MLRSRLACLLLLFGGVASAQSGQIPERLNDGIRLMQEQRYPEAQAAFDALVSADPEDGEAWHRLGLAHHFAGNLDQAIRAHFHAIQFIGQGHPLRTHAIYNVACVYALQNKTERALQWLHRARNAGFSDFGLLQQDTDLAALRDDPRFAAFLKSAALAAPAEGSATATAMTEVLPGGTGGVDLGPDGDLYVANFGGDVWRLSSDGSYEIFATGFTKAADCTFDSAGNLLQVDHATSQVWSIDPDGKRTNLPITGLNSPVGIDTGPDGSLYITNFRDDSILHVSPDGTSRKLAEQGLLNGPNGIAWAGEHGLFVVNYKDGTVLQLDPESGAIRFLCDLPGGGCGHAAWTGETLFVTDRSGHRLFAIDPDGAMKVVAGSGQQGTVDGGAATSQLSLPNGIAVTEDASTIYVNERLSGNRSIVRRVELN